MSLMESEVRDRVRFDSFISDAYGDGMNGIDVSRFADEMKRKGDGGAGGAKRLTRRKTWSPKRTEGWGAGLRNLLFGADKKVNERAEKEKRTGRGPREAITGAGKGAGFLDGLTNFKKKKGVEEVGGDDLGGDWVVIDPKSGRSRSRGRGALYRSPPSGTTMAYQKQATAPVLGGRRRKKGYKKRKERFDRSLRMR